MTNFTSFFFIIALLCYVVIALYFVKSLMAEAGVLAKKVTDAVSNNSLETKPKQFRINRHISIIILAVGFVCHAVCLYDQLIIGNGNINFNLFNIISLTSWLMLGFSLLFTSYRPIIVLNVLAAPIAGVGLVLGYINSQPAYNTQLSTLSLSMEMHIFLSIAAYSVLFMAAMQAVLLHLQNRELKHKTKTRVWVRLLPALQTMERLLFDMILCGFVLLSVALTLGFFGVTNFLEQHLAHKTVFSVLAWLLFAGLIFGHWKFGWRGKLAANMTLWGFGLLAIGFVGTRFVLEILLA